MTDDQGRVKKQKLIGRLERATGRLQQSFPEIQQLIRTTDAVDLARKIVGPAQSIFRQFADDIQLKDLLAKAEALVANTNLGFPIAAPKASRPAAAFRDETSANESEKNAGARKTPSREKTVSKKKKKRAPKRRAKARA